jgi:hypothetical protein
VVVVTLVAGAFVLLREVGVYEPSFDGYQRTGDARKIVVTVTAGLGDEIVGSQAQEDASAVTVTVRVRAAPGSKPSLGVALPAIVTLRDPLGDRAVRDRRGETVRDLGQYQPSFPRPPDATAGVFFPVLQPASAIPLALLQGRIVSRGGCLWIQPAEGRELCLALWPPGSRLDKTTGRVTTRDASGAELVIAVGDRLRVGGGETKDLDHVVTITGQKPPLACQTGEAYWSAYQITRLP